MYNQKEKICTLYASDEHFITILIPYIYEIINEDKEIITIFERDLSNTAEKVLKCIKEKNKKILNIDWNKVNINNLNSKLNKKLENKILIVLGENKFIEKVNFLLDKFEENFLILNCYNIFKNEKKIRKIIEEYEKILTTQGIEKIKKTIPCKS